MPRYSLAEAARDDLLAIWEYIARNNIPAADRTMDRLTE
ncbi:MAG: type II toxin-antitoxin system RelE/ParE family toxin [Planctomycetales bacterium]|nr:type II toxin-antitoxin system RelE/ParE family toxin [Planctomycetales bacterium]